jgi:hypothetical protein
MKKEKLPFFNNNLNKTNSGEELPFISISNSKSNSSKNQSSKTSSNNYKVSLTQNNNSSSNSKNNNKNSSFFNIIRTKLSRNNKNDEEKSSEFFTFTENSILPSFYDLSFNNKSNKYSSNLSLSEDKKESKIKIEKKPEIETPKKKHDYNAEFFKKSKNTKKAVLSIDNYAGKNLMEDFKDMFVTTEEKNKNRVSSAENISDNTLTLKNNFINTNKSWNKNNINIVKLPKNPVKIVDKYKNISEVNNKKEKTKNPKEINLATFSGKNAKRSSSNLKNNSLKNFQNFFKLNNKNLLKYMVKKTNKNNQNIGLQINYVKNNNDLNKINTEKKVNNKIIKKTPKSDSYNRKLSFSYLKKRESVLKNLFHDYKPKQNEDININTLPLQNKLSPKVIKETKQTFSSNIFDKIINNNNKNVFNKTKPIKKESIEKRSNIKKINNYNDMNSYFFKFKDKKEIQKQNEKPINKVFNNKNKNEKI